MRSLWRTRTRRRSRISAGEEELRRGRTILAEPEVAPRRIGVFPERRRRPRVDDAVAARARRLPEPGRPDVVDEDVEAQGEAEAEADADRRSAAEEPEEEEEAFGDLSIDLASVSPVGRRSSRRCGCRSPVRQIIWSRRRRRRPRRRRTRRRWPSGRLAEPASSMPLWALYRRRDDRGASLPTTPSAYCSVLGRLGDPGGDTAVLDSSARAPTPVMANGIASLLAASDLRH